METSIVTDLVRLVITQLPFLLALVLGLAIAVMGWQRAPKAALPVLAGVVIAGLSWMWDSFAWRILAQAGPADENARSIMYGVLSFLGSLGYGISLVLLCAAAFMDRSPSHAERMH